MNSLPSAFIVHYKMNGQNMKFITLEHERANQYAIKHHGIVNGLYELETAIPLILAPSNVEVAPFIEGVDNVESC